jgi:hypothetical protein
MQHDACHRNQKMQYSSGLHLPHRRLPYDRDHDPSDAPARRLPHRTPAIQALEAQLRRRGRAPRARHCGRRRHPPWLQAEAQQLRPGRGHRTERRAQPRALRAPRGAQRDRHQRQGPHLLFGRQHLHAGRVEPRMEGELLQVHQRNAQRPRGLVEAFGPQVHRGRERRLRRRRLRAGAGLRRNLAGGRPLFRRVAARSAAARRAARHRRPDPRDRQAPRAP